MRYYLCIDGAQIGGRGQHPSSSLESLPFPIFFPLSLSLYCAFVVPLLCHLFDVCQVTKIKSSPTRRGKQPLTQTEEEILCECVKELKANKTRQLGLRKRERERENGNGPENCHKESHFLRETRRLRRAGQGEKGGQRCVPSFCISNAGCLTSRGAVLGWSARVCVCGREQDRLIYCSGSGSSECIIGGFLAPWQDTCFPLVLHDPLSLIGIDDFFESSDLEGMFPFSLVEELDIHPLPSQLRSQV